MYTWGAESGKIVETAVLNSGKKQLDAGLGAVIVADLKGLFPKEGWTIPRFRACVRYFRLKHDLSINKGQGRKKRKADVPDVMNELVEEILLGAQKRIIDAVGILLHDRDEEIKKLKDDLEKKTKMLRDLKDVREAVAKFRGFEE